MSIRVKQNATYKGNDWWKWSVWLEGEEKELDGIQYVDYMLHPSFPRPVQRVESRKTKFRLDSSGWGEFKIYVQIMQKDGKTRKRSHWLTLEYPPEKAGMTAKLKAPLSKEATQNEPCLFLSFAASDIRIADLLADALEDENIEVLRTDDLSSGLPWETSLNALLSRASFAVCVISERSSSWVTREARAILNKEIPMIPVLVGSVPETSSMFRESGPLNLAQLKAIRIKDEADAASAARSIAKRVKQSLENLKSKAKK